ncbi:hypothetical protein LCM00_13960 [Bacillus infantis]|uniref:hypothetical protein n=1 Tax=Bacillus infantis TaxID=324767 RepID=UPI001CD70A84|nr:hypothetical protein [Bacillus infantis]MCA1040613.1 hypothetical protein [Bacillus infantis]
MKKTKGEIMNLSQQEIEEIMKAIEPKIKKSLYQTGKENREDLEQELREAVLRKLRDNKLEEVPGFFEMMERGE